MAVTCSGKAKISSFANKGLKFEPEKYDIPQGLQILSREEGSQTLKLHDREWV